jgi:enoyl-CoA hydratase/carnithine racemase
MSVALSRQLLWKMLGADHPVEAHRLDSKCIFWMGSGPDAQEGVVSFLQKRPPQFKLRPSADMPAFYPWGVKKI